MTRVYYWLAGVPANRPSGVWWYKDFIFHAIAQGFVADMKPLCRKIKVFKGKLPKHNPNSIEPPPEAKDVPVNNKNKGHIYVRATQ